MFRALMTLAVALAVLVSACAAPAPAGSPTSVPTQPSVLQAPSPTPAATPSTSAPAASGTPVATSAALDPATIDPCSLVPSARVAEVIGEEVTDGVLLEGEDSAGCFFDVPAWPVPVMIPEDSGVSIRVWREPQTVAAYDPNANSDQQVVAAVEGLGDGAWWRHHVELPNVHIDTDDAVLTVITEPVRFSIAFIQIPNPVGVDSAEWLANLTELANDVLVALGR